MLVMQEYERKFVRPAMFQEIYSHIQVLVTDAVLLFSPYINGCFAENWSLTSSQRCLLHVRRYIQNKLMSVGDLKSFFHCRPLA